MSLSVGKTDAKPKSNVFTDTGGIVAREGLHLATVISTRHVGKSKTKYGLKDFQMFVLQVNQFTDAGEKETAEIHQQYHRSFDSKAALTAFLAAFGIRVQRGMTVDFDDLVGRQLQIVVTHAQDARGAIHANVRPQKRGAQ